MELYISGQVTNQTNSSALAYTAGFLEGVLTAPYISMHWQNTYAGYCNTPSQYCTNLMEFLDKNTNWLKQQIAQNKDDPYWFQASVGHAVRCGVMWSICQVSSVILQCI